MLEAFVGPRPPGQEGCHYDDDPQHNMLPNLRWDTRSGNQTDLVRNGRHHQTRKLECPVEHPLTPPNLVPSLLPKRSCLACSRARPVYRAAVARGDDVEYRTIANAKYAEIMGLVLL